MKVFYINRFDYNTADVFFHLLKIMKKENHEIFFVGPNEELEFHDKSERNFEGDNIFRVWNFKNYISKILNFCKIEKPDIVHFDFELRLFGSLDSAFFFPILLLLLKISGKKTIVTLHSIFRYRNNNKWKFINEKSLKIPKSVLRICSFVLIKTIGNLSDGIIVYNTISKKGLVEHYKINSEKIAVMNLAINEIKSNNLEKEKKFSYLDNKKFVLCFGTISPRKGLEVAIRTMKNIVKKDSDVVMLISGISAKYNREYEESLHELVKNLGLVENVLFLGYLDDEEIRIIFSKSQIALYLYKHSSSGTMGIHFAIKYKTPMIVTNIDTFTDILSEKDAFFVEPDDHKQLETQILNLLQNNELKHEFKKRLERLGTKFSWKNTAIEHYNFYKKIINR